MDAFSALLLGLLVAVFVAVTALFVIAKSFMVIGPSQVGLVTKRVSSRHNSTDTPIAFAGEAGYQSKLLMPGVRFKLWPTYSVAKYPWVQVPAGEIGVVISQIGDRLPTGAKSAVYRPEFGNFTNLRAFLSNGGRQAGKRPAARSWATAARRASRGRCSRRVRSFQSTRSRFWSSRPPRPMGCRSTTTAP